MEKSTVVAIVLLVCLPFFSETAFYPTNASNVQFTIVIDAGHGGKDSGALGSRFKEKDIALKLALRLGKYVQQYMSNVRVLYTRTTDEFIPLHERISIANNNNADLFFSIHCNSMVKSSKTVEGTETYVMGLHRAADNLNVAKRENKAVLLERDYAANYDGYDPNSPEGHIMLSMYQNAYLAQSLLLASSVEQQFVRTAKRKSRGVKQAGFLVLRTATMPSVLVETGFLSNTVEEQYLNSEKGQVYIASAMYRALRSYRHDVETKTNYNYQSVVGRSKAPVATIKSYSKPSNLAVSQQHQFTSKKVQPTNNTTNKAESNLRTKAAVSQAYVIQKTPSIEKMYPTTLAPETIERTPVGNYLPNFRIQLAAARQKIDLKTTFWSKIKGVECLKIENSYKCLIGNYTTLTNAIAQQNYWRKNGFKDAFVVAFRNGQKISIAEATQ